MRVVFIKWITDTFKVILQLSCIHLQHDHGHNKKLLTLMDRIRELQTEKRAAKRTLYNTNKREKKLRQKVATVKRVLAEHLEENHELKEKLSKFEGKLTLPKQQKFHIHVYIC